MQPTILGFCFPLRKIPLHSTFDIFNINTIVLLHLTRYITKKSNSSPFGFLFLYIFVVPIMLQDGAQISSTLYPGKSLRQCLLPPL
ncbi:hypothetical protein GDO78_010117 [Eleutherodactylus coqui]|uniref:Uncharacterized protein n=1 Tax=Eleutherodactylus coqui TaxID=57060 RepID=A0A8J6K8F0_ELECQ|nr:hypothetical protein GDO78_010117 [Eleutherodactylus coqui]